MAPRSRAYSPRPEVAAQVNNQVLAPDSAGSHGGVAWPVRSGLVPPLAEGFISRPESVPGLGQAVAPGATAALTPARTASGSAPGWFGSCGKTQPAAHPSQALLKARELDLLVWITPASPRAILGARAN